MPTSRARAVGWRPSEKEMLMHVEMIEGANVPRSSLPFSPGIRVGELVFVSGQASLDEQGAIVADSFSGEMRRSFENLERVLAGAGLGLPNVVQVRAYVDDAGHLAEYNLIYREYFGEPLPARTTLIGCLGGTLKFEVDAVACTTARH